jgi:hypothetical protein
MTVLFVLFENHLCLDLAWLFGFNYGFPVMPPDFSGGTDLPVLIFNFRVPEIMPVLTLNQDH